MQPINIRFVISQLSEEEIDALKNAQPIITKMILTPDDFKLFHYKDGDSIEVETENGNRLWSKIVNLETIENPERVILIFTLEHIFETVSR